MIEYPENETIRGILASRSAHPEAQKILSEDEAHALDLIQKGLDMYTQDSPQGETHTMRVGFTRTQVRGGKYFVGCFKNGKCVSSCVFNGWGNYTIERITNWVQRFFKEL